MRGVGLRVDSRRAPCKCLREQFKFGDRPASFITRLLANSTGLSRNC
jgi:hypothetical protein